MDRDEVEPLRQVQPVLPCRDVAASVAFYETLGFERAFQDDPEAPGYAGVRNGVVELHLQWHAPEEWDREGVDRPMLRFPVEDPDAWYRKLKPAGVFHRETRLRNTIWGTREFGFYDPDLNGLIFYRDLRPGESPD